MAQKLVVKIAFNEGGMPSPINGPEVTAQMDDTIRFESPDGKVRINFPAPLGGRSIEIAGETDHRVVVEQGRFPYQCGITRPDGTHVGWPGDTTGAAGGAVVIVRRF